MTYLGGVGLTSRDDAFGGYSSLSVAGDRFTLLSDFGDIVRFRMDATFQISDPGFGDLPAGPGLGWEKRERDNESMTVDPASGEVWVGFERANAIWHYWPGILCPSPMRRRRPWRAGKGMAGPDRWCGCTTGGSW